MHHEAGLRLNSARLLLAPADLSDGYLATWPGTPGVELKLELNLPTPKEFIALQYAEDALSRERHAP